MPENSKTVDLKGFRVLKVRFSDTSTAEHDVFMKEHSVKNQMEETPIGRTLLLINVPPWATEQSIRVSFETIQINVENVLKGNINKADSGFKSFFVVCKTAADLYKALRIRSLPVLSTKEKPIETGLTKWINQYNSVVNSQAEMYERSVELIKRYDADEVAAKLKDKGGEVDDEGWTVVSKKSRTPGLARKESVQNKLTEKMNKKEKVLKNFYRHQIRQEKQDHLATLRRKAEDDKKKIVALKQRRAFKPF